jgi:5-formyltetrahydrofolate cyclo-ligase
MTKAELRTEFQARRQQLTTAEVALRSQRLCDLFFANFDLSLKKTLHTFLPIEHANEPDTWMVLGRLRREYPNVRIVLPKLDPANGGCLIHIEFEGMQQLQKNTWGIPEPQQGTRVPPARLDLVLVPLLAADRTGHRLGYGKGFYDRFLPLTRPDCLRIGYSLLPLSDEPIPADPWDVRLTHAVTPDGVVVF